ncbi:molybdopterin-dependent oxidoreductase [Metallosphaera tengchongensis]|uniref:Molybdopterin-dependent oxidoreductase n=1 Tax=Metallosphaera tengchongensis TaxID=1532350 RepID=A0A6N0NX62_9CREN|nr:molybdopterin-dependent oxidoreductase [Metallosphaera tengchongensis]QKR00785.1 molybdopterin-dependent oxidoreductase [Metallosphaera tengchongensis]
MKRRNFLKLMLVSASLIALYRLGGNGLNSLLHTNGVTPFGSWYIVQVGSTPNVNVENYVLTVDGDVSNPLQLTYSQLTSMPSVTVKDTIQCVSDPLFLRANVEWTGVPLSNILRLAGPDPSAIKVLTFGAEGYTADLPIEKATDDVIVAYMVDGKPLPQVHGYPVRMVVPGWWGYTYTKWLVRIHVTSKNVLGYWESLGYPDDAVK